MLAASRFSFWENMELCSTNIMHFSFLRTLQLLTHEKTCVIPVIIAGRHILARYNIINKYNTAWNAIKLAAGLSEVYNFDTLGNLM